MLDGAQSAFGGSCPCLGIYGKRAAECSITTLSLLFLQAVLEQTNYATFQALLQFAATAHQDPNSSNSFAQRRRIIPTALTFAGGVNSADHAQTFPALVNLLRQQVRLTHAWTLASAICWCSIHGSIMYCTLVTFSSNCIISHIRMIAHTV